MVTDKEVEQSLENREKFDIMFEDLKPDIQKALLEFLGLKDTSEGNYDTFPLFSVFLEDEE